MKKVNSWMWLFLLLASFVAVHGVYAGDLVFVDDQARADMAAL